MVNKHGTVRIRGLVRLMNSIRDQMRAGVAADEVEDLRATVQGTIREVDRICRERKTTPARLPAPSRRAYEYLRGLDLTQVPGPGFTPTSPQPRIRITGLIAACSRYHREFFQLAEQRSDPFEAEDARLQQLSSRLCAETNAISDLCQSAGGTPESLPVRSWRAFQWLRFLSDPRYLALHLETLAFVTQEGRRRLLAKEQPRGPKSVLSVEIYGSSMLYQTKVDGSRHHILVNEGYIGAPKPLLRKLVQAALGRTKDDANYKALKDYTASDAFASIHADLRAASTAAAPAAPSRDAQGVYHSLNAAFDRVNAAYFSGQMHRPRLVWSRTRTTRKLGHYDQAQDSMMVSITLDAPGVPDYVVDFVVYHELLHKSLGTKVVNGRRRAHTSAFRKAERGFRQYSEARAVISALTRSGP